MNHVGRPEMLLGKRFLPLTGTPIWNIELRMMRFEDCEPVPFAVAIFIVKSLQMRSIFTCISIVQIDTIVLSAACPGVIPVLAVPV